MRSSDRTIPTSPCSSPGPTPRKSWKRNASSRAAAAIGSAMSRGWKSWIPFAGEKLANRPEFPRCVSNRGGDELRAVRRVVGDPRHAAIEHSRGSLENAGLGKPYQAADRLCDDRHGARDRGLLED